MKLHSRLFLGPLIWAGCLLLLLIIAFLRWPSEDWLATGFQELLPAITDNPWERRSTVASSTRYERQIIFFVGGASRADAKAFSSKVEQSLIESGYAMPNFAQEQAQRWLRLSQHLRRWQPGLITPHDSQLLLDDPETYLTSFQGLLFSPVGGAWAHGLTDDPLGLMRNFLDRAMPDSHGDLHGALVLAQLPQESLSFKRLGGLYTLYQNLKGEAAGEGLSLHAVGAPLYSAYGVQSAQREVSSIGFVSFLTLVLLLAWSLRSGRGLLLTLLSVVSGLLGGAMITVALQQEVHVLALVFGATLIGIAADYAFHYLCHSLLPDWTPQDGLRPVFRALVLGAASSSLAFLLLAMMPFPGLRQIGTFMAGGLLFALLTVCLLFPTFYRGANVSTSPIRGRIGNFHLPSALRFPLIFLLLLVTVMGLGSLRGVDEVRDFYAVPSDLLADETHFKDALDLAGDSRHLLLMAPTVEDLLQLEENLLAEYPELTPGVTALVPSGASQHANRALQKDLVAQGLLQRHVDRLGLGTSVVDSFAESLAATYEPLVPSDLEFLELPLGAEGFLGCEEEICASYLSAGFDESSFSPPAGVKLVDPVGQINGVMRDYRVAMVKMLVIALLVAVLLLAFVLGWRRALEVSLVPAGACLLSLSVIGLVYGEYSIIHLLALLLIVGVGLDYAIFRALTPTASQPATILAITLSGLTSVLAFGMLSLSSTPVISDFGQTIAFGLVFAWLLSLPGVVISSEQVS